MLRARKLMYKANSPRMAIKTGIRMLIAGDGMFLAGRNLKAPHIRNARICCQEQSVNILACT